MGSNYFIILLLLFFVGKFVASWQQKKNLAQRAQMIFFERKKYQTSHILKEKSSIDDIWIIGF